MMLTVEGLLVVVLLLKIQCCFVQATGITQIKYQLVTVEANSFTSIRTTNLGAG